MRALLLLAAFLPSLAQAQNGRLPDSLSRRVDSVFARYDRTVSPGCALGVYRDGKLLYSRGYGMANLEHAIAITPRTIFDIGSTSKQFTAAAIALLAQDGKLTLDDDVRRHVPELPDYGKTITIRHLLNHTSGLRDYLTLMSLPGVLTTGRVLTYALGLMVEEYRGLRRVRHGGSWAGYRADLVRFPEAKTTVACLCNLGTANPSTLADRAADILLADRLGPATTAATGASSAALDAQACPLHDHSRRPAALRRHVLRPRTRRDFRGGARFRRRPGHDARRRTLPAPRDGTRHFSLRGLTIIFGANRRGQPTAMTIDARRVRGIRAEHR